MSKNYVIKEKNLTGLTKALNEQFKKQTGKSFTVGDVQSYARRGYLPAYLGDYTIEVCKQFEDIKLYNVIKNS